MGTEISLSLCKDASLWDEIVENSAHGKLFHRWEWLKIAGNHTGHHLIPLIGYQHAEPVVICPIFLNRTRLYSVVTSPPPQSAIFGLGPVFTNYQTSMQYKKEMVVTAFLEAFDRYITDELNPDYQSIDLPIGFPDPRPFKWSGYTVRPYFDYVIDLNPGFDHLYAGLPKKRKGDIRRAKKRGMDARIGDREDLGKVLDLMRIRYTEQNKPITIQNEYVCELYEAFSKNVKIIIVEKDEEILSGVIDLFYKNEAFSWIGSPRPFRQISPSPNDYLLCTAIQHACSCGVKKYIHLGNAGNARLHKYYASKFTPELTVRWGASKKTFKGRCMESAYLLGLKPLRTLLKKESVP